MNGYGEFLLKLPGTEEEKEWLESRLEMLSVKEDMVLAAAVELKPPENMADAVNHLLTLGMYDVLAGSYEQLGGFYLREQSVPKEQRPFFDREKIGLWYEYENPGLFVDGSYVAYPDWTICSPYDGGCPLSDDMFLDWSVRLKLASEQVPEGVWVKLPDQEDDTGRPDEIHLALDELKVRTIDECSLLEARCILPCIHDIASQYRDLADLMYDGDSLGYFLDAYRGREPGMLDKFLAVLEREGCCCLAEALHITEGLNDYDLISVDAFIDRTRQDLSGPFWEGAGEVVRGCFNYAAYAASLAEQQGYSVTDDGLYYIRKRDSPELAPQQGGMTMQ